MKFKKIALVHDWLFHMRGGERVLEAIAELFPEAEIYTLFLEKGNLSPALQKHSIHASVLNYLPHSKRIYQWLLPALPWAIERFDLDSFDLVISSSHCVAKGVRAPKGVPHICYCHTPMRYAWYFEEEYFGDHHTILKQMISHFILQLKKWDVESSSRVTHFIANSKNVAKRVREIYHRRATVIYPHVEIERFQVKEKKGDYYLIVSALVPYKRIDLAVRAFNQLNLPLWIVGTGGEGKKLKREAKDNIHFLDWVPDGDLARLYQSAKALIFPGEEDFGITPLEAQACGTPVIAYGRGGVLETVEPGVTGIFFDELSIDALKDAVAKCEKMSFDPHLCRAQAEKFSKERLQKEFLEAVKSL